MIPSRVPDWLQNRADDDDDNRIQAGLEERAREEVETGNPQFVSWFFGRFDRHIVDDYIDYRCTTATDEERQQILREA